MSKGLTRTYSLRKRIQPIVDIDEEDDDEQRRDSFGRKRVDVVDCLLDSSSDNLDDGTVDIQRSQHILWLTLEEIRHIRYVFTLSDRNRPEHLCFRCRKRLNYFFFLPSFLRFTTHEICFICQQMICKKCSFTNFHPPSSNVSIPVRIEKLIKPASTMIIENTDEKSNAQTKTVCYDCLQIFDERTKISQQPVTTFRRTFSLPLISRKTSNDGRYTRHHRRLTTKARRQIEG